MPGGLARDGVSIASQFRRWWPWPRRPHLVSAQRCRRARAPSSSGRPPRHRGFRRCPGSSALRPRCARRRGLRPSPDRRAGGRSAFARRLSGRRSAAARRAAAPPEPRFEALAATHHRTRHPEENLTAQCSDGAGGRSRSRGIDAGGASGGLGTGRPLLGGGLGPGDALRTAARRGERIRPSHAKS